MSRSPERSLFLLDIYTAPSSTYSGKEQFASPRMWSLDAPSRMITSRASSAMVFPFADRETRERIGIPTPVRQCKARQFRTIVATQTTSLFKARIPAVRVSPAGSASRRDSARQRDTGVQVIAKKLGSALELFRQHGRVIGCLFHRASLTTFSGSIVANGQAVGGLPGRMAYRVILARVSFSGTYPSNPI